MDTFLGLDFEPFSVERRACLEAVLSKSPQPLAGYTVATLLAWDPMFSYRFARVGETLLIAFTNAAGERHLMQPVGAFPARFSQALLDRAAALPYPLQLHYVTREFVDAHPELAQGMEVLEDRDVSNYVYEADDLADLPGKKFSAKRNLIAQANGGYSWKSEVLAPSDTAECLALVDALNIEASVTLTGLPLYEYQALKFTLENFEPLEQRGEKITIDGHIEAFALWEPLTPSTAGIHFERARRSFKGLYQVVNRETARRIRGQGFARINREEDVGDEGLRKAKLSYHPVEIAPAFTLTARKVR